MNIYSNIQTTSVFSAQCSVLTPSDCMTAWLHDCMGGNSLKPWIWLVTLQSPIIETWNSFDFRQWSIGASILHPPPCSHRRPVCCHQLPSVSNCKKPHRVLLRSTHKSLYSAIGFSIYLTNHLSLEPLLISGGLSRWKLFSKNGTSTATYVGAMGTQKCQQ